MEHATNDKARKMGAVARQVHSTRLSFQHRPSVQRPPQSPHPRLAMAVDLPEKVLGFASSAPGDDHRIWGMLYRARSHEVFLSSSGGSEGV
jgi:hypothetical protein